MLARGIGTEPRGLACPGGGSRSIDREAGVLPSEDLVGEVGIQQTLVEEQGDDTATPDLSEGGGGPEGDEEEGVVAVETALQDDRVPVGVPHAELAESLRRLSLTQHQNSDACMGLGNDPIQASPSTRIYRGPCTSDLALRDASTTSTINAANPAHTSQRKISPVAP